MKPLNQYEQPTSLPIKKIVQENENVRTFYFDVELGSQPGQFVIMWIPRVDEKPFSIATDKDGVLGLSIATVGPFTEKLFELKEGDLVGIRGPYGAYFTLAEGDQRILLIGGGYGTAPLATLAEAAVARGMTVDFCNGARTKDLLLFEKRLEKIGGHNHYSTNDGSYGTQGTTVDIATELMKKNQYDRVYTCGPELMEYAVTKLAAEHDVPCQVSVERYMKCGFGICGQCCLDGDGKRMCLEGPVVSGEYALSQKEFGQYHRGKSGKKVFF